MRTMSRPGRRYWNGRLFATSKLLADSGFKESINHQGRHRYVYNPNVTFLLSVSQSRLVQMKHKVNFVLTDAFGLYYAQKCITTSALQDSHSSRSLFQFCGKNSSAQSNHRNASTAVKNSSIWKDVVFGFSFYEQDANPLTTWLSPLILK